MIDAIQLKEFLQAQVGSQLGTYRFSGGMQATAIAILPRFIHFSVPQVPWEL